MCKLKDGERLDDLQTHGYEIIQHPGKFCFGMDAVLLASYAKVKRGECALDIGTGTGIIPILMTVKTDGENARQNSHERGVRMADKQKAQEGKEAANDRRDNHAAHITANRAREDGNHKTVARLLLLAHDGADFRN